MKVAKRDHHNLSTKYTNVKYKWIKEHYEKGELMGFNENYKSGWVHKAILPNLAISFR